MVAGVSECSFALAGLGIDLPLTELEGTLFDVVFGLELTQALAGGVVVVGGGLAGQFEGALPHAVGEGGDVGGHAGERSGVAVDAGSQIPPKTFEGISNRVGRTAAQGLAQGLDRRPSLGFEDRDRSPFDVRPLK